MESGREMATFMEWSMTQSYPVGLVGEGTGVGLGEELDSPG